MKFFQIETDEYVIDRFWIYRWWAIDSYKYWYIEFVIILVHFIEFLLIFFLKFVKYFQLSQLMKYFQIETYEYVIDIFWIYVLWAIDSYKYWYIELVKTVEFLRKKQIGIPLILIELLHLEFKTHSL